MRQTCERIGCGLDVAVVYGTVPGRDGSLTLWIDAFRPDITAAREREIMGYVCRRHGERLSPPRGWLVDDRRESAPRLFRPQPDLTIVRDKAPRSRRDRVRDLPRPSLFAEAPPVVENPVAEIPVTEASLVEASAVRTSTVQTSTVQTPPVQTSAVVEAPTESLVEPVKGDEMLDESLDDTQSWQPFFDPDDDLDGMLNATGSMLRDAFRSRHNGRRHG